MIILFSLYSLNKKSAIKNFRIPAGVPFCLFKNAGITSEGFWIEKTNTSLWNLQKLLTAQWCNLSYLILSEKIKQQKDGAGEKLYEGQDLKIGGKGMIGFYGSPTEGKEGIVGKIAKEVVKELTGKEGKIGETKIATDKGYDAERKNVDWDNVKINVTKVKSGAREGLYFATLEGGGLFENVKTDGDVHYFEYEKDARDFAKRHIEDIKDQSKYLSTQHSIEITPEVKAAVKRGMPLFIAGGLALKGVLNDSTKYDLSFIPDKYKGLKRK